MVCDGDSKAYNSVWDVYGCCEDCSKWEQMNKKSNEYKKWVDSDAHEQWKLDHELGQSNCPRVMKLDCIGNVQKRAGTALREFRKKEHRKVRRRAACWGKKTQAY